MRAFVALVLAVSATAAAEPPGGAPPALEEAMPSYRLQLAGTDAAAALTLLVGEKTTDSNGQRDQTLIALGIATFALGSPIVHLVHGHGKRALASFLLRGVAPLVTAEIGAQLKTCFVTSSADCDISSASDSHRIAGLVLGVASAMAIDYTFFGAAERPRPEPSWAPSVGATRGGVSLGIAGTF